ncbi:hypothetical protein [Dysosmobacter sp.]|uniref:hypothetical protein n=1 Tax=Dysosmobacter sp. TaxID=2591382 RepID=UPI003A91B0DB
MKRTTIAYLLVTILGALLAAVGLLSARVDALPLIVSKILAPLGATVFGVGLGGLFGQGLLQSDPVLRQREKERHDERNTAIRYRAEAWSGNVTTVLLALGGAVSGYMDAPLWVTILLLGTAVFNVLLSGVFTLWFRRRM